MNIILSHSSGVPIYEQIVAQIKQQILVGVLKEGDTLPSMRVLAAELQVSLITTKRAYEELEKCNMIETVAGKGCFVKGQNQEGIREEYQKKIEGHLQTAVKFAKVSGVSVEEMQELLEVFMQDEREN